MIVGSCYSGKGFLNSPILATPVALEPSAEASLRAERFGSIIARRPSVSGRFLRFLLYPFIEPALLPLHRACFHLTINREDFREPLVLEPRTVRIWAALSVSFLCWQEFGCSACCNQMPIGIGAESGAGPADFPQPALPLKRFSLQIRKMARGCGIIHTRCDTRECRYSASARNIS